MSFFAISLNVITPIVVVVALSAIVTAYFKLEARSISTLSVYLFTPFLVLTGMASMQLSIDEFGRIGLFMLLLTLSLSVIGLAFSRIFKWDVRLTSVFLLSVLQMNAANYGIPLNEFAYGEQGANLAMVYYVVSAIIGNTFGVYLASRGAASSNKSMLNILKVPLLYGLIFGMIINFNNISMPLPLQRTFDLLAQAAIPTMMAVLGIQLLRAWREARSGKGLKLMPVLLASGTRLIIAPLVAAVLVSILGIDGMTRQVLIVQSGMPTAILAGVLAAEFDGDANFVTSVILISTLGSILTLNVLLAIV